MDDGEDSEDSDDVRDTDEQAHEDDNEAPLSDHPLLHLDMGLIAGLLWAPPATACGSCLP
jgi:hypothetical protein